MKSKRQFWSLYAAAWLVYGASLAAVFVGGGFRFELDLLWTILANILPAFWLGGGVVLICERLLKWSDRRQPQFTLVHILLLLFFSFAWCFLTLFDLTLLTFIQRGTWNFVRWDNYGIQWQLFTGALAYVAIIGAVYARQTGENLQTEEHRNAELKMRVIRAEAARATAELAALRARLNPHFLFNTLHTLMALVRTDADIAEAAIERFALMLRYVLQSQEESCAVRAADATFGDEWNFVENYLELERLRFGDRLKLTTEIEPAALRFRLPAFSLQPIVENAVKYAIAPRADGGRLHISAQSVNGSLIVKVCDDGDGKLSDGGRNGNGLGLRLVRESLAARFGPAANLKIEAAPGEGFKVSMTIPRSDGSEEDTHTPEIQE